jgi:hypothetical protein
VKVLIRLKDNNIERLEEVCSMRWKAEGDNLMIIAEIDELLRAVGAISVEQK